MRNVARLLLAAAAVLVAGTQYGTAGALVVGQLLAVVGLVALLGGLPALRRPPPLVPAGPGPRRERFPRYDQLHRFLLLASDGRPVDGALRPVLQSVVEAQLAERSADELRAALGERTWQLVDPGRPAAGTAAAGELDVETVTVFLDRLDAL